MTRGFGGEWFGEKYGVGEERVRERLERLEKGGRKARVEEWVERAEKGDLDGVSFDFGAFGDPSSRHLVSRFRARY